jgi:hypothetical protein
VDQHHALIVADNSAAGAVYKALTLGSNSKGNFIYATNFFNGTVDVFDSHFQQVQLAGSFTDSGIPDGFTPFGIRNINGTIFVTYAKQNDTKHDDVACPGNGFIDEFDTDGNFSRRFASQGALNSPHGMALAPANFGEFSNALLVGNFGDGRINAFDPTTGAKLGELSDANNQPITDAGIWGMTFGNGARETGTNILYFVAGINHEQDGLFGAISVGPKGNGKVARTTPRQGQEILDAVFAQFSPPVGHQSKRILDQYQETRNSPAQSTIETLGFEGNQVSTPVSEHQTLASALHGGHLDLMEVLDTNLFG